MRDFEFAFGCVRSPGRAASNLYGAFDNFDLQSSQVIPALMVKAHRAKTEKTSLHELAPKSSHIDLDIDGVDRSERIFSSGGDQVANAVNLTNIPSGRRGSLP